MKVRRLSPGEPLPSWVRALDEITFGEAWGEPEPNETVWMLDESAFARWSLAPAAFEAELFRIAVDQERRGEGLGHALLEACQKELSLLGIRELHLEVRASNTAARALYLRSGWREAGTRKHYYRDGEDALLYAKPLG